MQMRQLLFCLALTACSTESPGGTAGQVHVVLFTHIEDSAPAGTLGSDQSRTVYLGLRAKMIEMAERSAAHDLRWVLQPDWKWLEAARLYEDSTTTATTGGKNVLRYLHEDLRVTIDPHSHENGGYNYADVAYLLGELGVGGSTVIGGHIWDPSLPQFQQWDRFRAPIAGEKYPSATWRGDLLIGAGTPNHVNDPLVSGVWRPQDRDHYFVDDPDGNIVAVGAWNDHVAGVEELVAAYTSGAVAPDRMLTASWNITPSELTAAGGVDSIESSVLVPLAALRDDGRVVVTDFQTLVAAWQADVGGAAFLYQP
ncbi:MAG: hypothetical protein NT062_25965 [Proteobacteria bacterium]|nr:hypothetical protein [Pseudomonadota bacterium]